MRCCFKKQEAQEKELLETVAMVENLVSHKTKSINIVLPVLMTVVTPILTYLFTTKFEFHNVSDKKAIVFATIYVLIAWGILLFAHLPIISRCYKKTNAKYTKGEFSPSNLTHGAYLSDNDFLKAYEAYFDRELLNKEKSAVLLLKNKINEMRFRINCLSWVYVLLIIGVFLMLVLLLLVIMGVV